MREQKVAKVTISLPQALLAAVDRLARECGTTRSAIIAKLVEDDEQARTRALMEEGYQEMAAENRRLAEESFSSVSDTVSRGTEWNESDGDQAR